MTWAIVAGVVSAIGAAVSTTVQIEQAKSNQRATEMQLNYQRQVAMQNAQLKEQQAQDATRRGEVETGKLMQKQRAFKGSQQAIMAAHGLDLSSGTPLDIQTGTDQMAAADIQALMHNSALEVWGHRVEANNYKTDAQNLEWQKVASRQATKNQIMGSVISGHFAGASSVGGALMNYYKGQQQTPQTGGTGSVNSTMLTAGRNTGWYEGDWEHQKRDNRFY